MTINERQIYYALDKMTYLAGKGVTVSLSVKNDGSFDMTVNPHIIGMIDDEEIDDVQDKKSNQRCQYREDTKYSVTQKDFYESLRKNDIDSLMEKIKDHNIFVSPYLDLIKTYWADQCVGDENISELCEICPYKSKV